MKIAVTGGSGFIGRWLLSELNSEYEFFVIGRKNLKKINVSDQDFSYVSSNYSIDELVQVILDMDAVVHLAAVRSGKKDFFPYLENIQCSHNLFEACIKVGVKNIICASSIAVYGRNNPVPWKEDQRSDPDGFYGISKATMEMLAGYYNKMYDMKIRCFRLAQVIGIGENRGIVPVFMKKAAKQEVLPIFGSGSGKREYIYVKDVVSAIDASLKHSAISGIYNIGTNTATSHLDVAKCINQVFNNEGNIAFESEKSEDTSVFLMDSGKSKKELNWQAEWSLQQAIEDMKHDMD
jgi:UDP-glucose 4-epimerase